ncbi:MAG: protein-methionine-sulfoxide reductase catalytic subunit MsrP, partial [Oxalobacteraceae bacterium]
MLFKRNPNGLDLPYPSEITPQEIYTGRREFITRMAATAAVGSGVWEMANREAFAQTAGQKLAARANVALSTDEKQTPFKDAAGYNNFYEFGLDKGDPAENAHTLRTRPWTVRIEGEVKKPLTLDIDSLLKLAPLEERVYRLRCVEGWSMVIPWVGYSLSNLLKQVEPTGNAKFVEFTTLADPKQMPGLRSGVLDWPYVEGLRIDEAMHPLTMLTMGMYGQVLPNQNGAPVRLVVPWKYGFKSAKSLVRIRLLSRQPKTAWND